jgi:dTMP kinase
LKRGLFITLEGIDGSGKSTQLHRLTTHLRNRGYKVRATREPGGTSLGEEIRRILLTSEQNSAAGRGRIEPVAGITPMAELTLMYAARAQHLVEVLRPALARGEIVVSDRYNDASLAYQGYGRKLGVETVRAFDRIVCGPAQPDLTIVFDLPPQLALSRAVLREQQGNSNRARFEAEGVKFQRRVRAGYLEIARQEPERVKVIRADRVPDEVQAEIRRLVDGAVARWERTKLKRDTSKRKCKA